MALRPEVLTANRLFVIPTHLRVHIHLPMKVVSAVCTYDYFVGCYFSFQKKKSKFYYSLVRTWDMRIISILNYMPVQ